MGYTERRDAILAHAKAAALTANPTWTDVAVGLPLLVGSKGCRVFYGGEIEPARMGGNRVLNGELVSHRIEVVAWWALSNMSSESYRRTDDEMHEFVDALRTNVLGDSQLGGLSTDLDMGYALPDITTVGGTRFAVVQVEFTTDYTEYSIAP